MLDGRTEPKGWGAQGYVQALGETRDAPSDYRAKWEEMEPTGGMVPWIIGRHEE